MDLINPGLSLHLLSINIYIFNSDPNETVREFAAKILGELKAIDAVDQLITALRNAVFMILQDKSDIYLELLKKVLDNEDFETRLYSKQAIKFLRE
jgi:HEAT repeat protein